MITSVDMYLDQLKKNLAGCDVATIQDAMTDAEEYLRNGLEALRVENSEMIEADALGKIIDEFGAPEEFAADYKKLEARLHPVIKPAVTQKGETNIFYRIFGIFADPLAWSSLVFMLVSMVTGILYFTWAVTGLSLSVGLLVLIISLPFIGLFFLSVRGVALIEGRIVEALLGVRMPRRPIFVDGNLGWWARFKVLFNSRHTWLTIFYMILMLPLGVIYFSIFITLISLSLGFILAPLAQLFLPFPMITVGNSMYYVTPDLGIMVFLLGIIFSIGTMNLAKVLGRWHGTLAKAMLVGE
ncbi:MAG: hypothetical protein GX577_16125 [Leptolinea sp.]|nr:hypothetical protein [Leptolinea sp.]